MGSSVDVCQRGRVGAGDARQVHAASAAGVRSSMLGLQRGQLGGHGLELGAQRRDARGVHGFGYQLFLVYVEPLYTVAKQKKLKAKQEVEFIKIKQNF